MRNITSMKMITKHISFAFDINMIHPKQVYFCNKCAIRNTRGIAKIEFKGVFDTMTSTARFRTIL